MDDFDIQAEFNIRAYDKSSRSEKKWEFTQEHLDQNLIANPDIVGSTFNLKHADELSYRLSRFVPVQDHMIYTVRKFTHKPWENGLEEGLRPMLYIPKTKEESYQHKPEGSDQEYTLRVTDFIGPKSSKVLRDQIHSFPENLDNLKTCSKEDLRKHEMKKLQWREYCGKGGVLEGLTFTKGNDDESMGFGQTKHHGNEDSEKMSDSIKKISVFYDEQWVTGINFFDYQGKQIGKTIGTPLGKGRQGEVKEVFIGLLPEERIVGVRIMEASNPLDGNADMLGKISFILSAPTPKSNNIHWCYSGKSVNHDCSKRFAEQQGQLLTIEEAIKLIKEHGPLFPGEDQWCAVAGGNNEWIQLGDRHHQPGTLHNKQFGPPDWGPKTEHFEWRNSFLWKDTESSLTAQKESIEVLPSVKVDTEKIPIEKRVPTDVFLSTIKVLKYFQDKNPELVKEILCESNLQPCMDAGPSVAYFGKAIYYFKRHLKGEKQCLRMWKYSFENNSESQVIGKDWDEDNDTQTKIQFFEQPNSENYESEEDWLNNTYISRQEFHRDFKEQTSAFQIYCLAKPGHAVYDSGDIKITYLSKLVLMRDSNKIKVYIWTNKQRYVFTLPKQEETITHSESDLEKTINKRENQIDYEPHLHFELRKSEISLGGTPTMIDYFMVPSKKKQVIFEVMGIDDDKKEQEASKIIKHKVSAGIFYKNKHSEATVQIDRSYNSSENVAFPAILPRRFAKDLFEPIQQIDHFTKLYESPDSRSIMYYQFEGADICVATLKADSKFKNVQDAFAALEFDPTTDELRINQLKQEVARLQKKAAEQEVQIKTLEANQ